MNNTLFDGFSKLTYQARIAKLLAAGLLNSEDTMLLNAKENHSCALADSLIENAIGYLNMPLGVAVNFKIDGQDYLVPMAVEETSVIAAASKTAKWIRQNGEIITKNLGNLAIGQIQIASVKDFEKFKKIIGETKNHLINAANETVAKNMVKRNGGVKDIIVRGVKRPDGAMMAIIHVLIETSDAMGANIINQICEFLKTPVETLTQEKVNLCILTNLLDTKLTQAEIIIHNIDAVTANAIVEASLFAQLDPYRAATHNKGILNGIDAVAIATGNDWRAVEAGIHAYAAYSGQYCAISEWKMENQQLIGIFKAPINVGIVGGVTRLHPIANLCLKLLGVKNAAELARVMAAVGLVQNLGALRALTTEGIVAGHMRLHVTNLCLAAGANNDEMPLLKQALENLLRVNKHISTGNAVDLLARLRSTKL